MKKVFLPAGALIFLVLIVSLTLNAGNDADSENGPIESRADLIQIDSMKQFGPLQRSAVSFPHDIHTQKTAAMGKDCTACHEKDPSGDTELVYRFMRIEDTDAKTVRDLYHDGCISCHEEILAKEEESGPVTCNACHTRTPEYAPGQAPMGFSASLHYRHTKTMEDKCEACHHEYDTATETLFYTKGNEGSCRYCHGEVAEGNRISMQSASHQACIACHQERKTLGTNAGPVECSGCHDPFQQSLIATVEEVPRYDRNQPDAVLLLPIQGDEEPAPTQPVAFDHLLHETSEGLSCRQCHHAEISKCNSCHTADGVEKGGGVSLMQSMHGKGSGISCLGCHDTLTRDIRCAGCHDTMPATRSQNLATCSACHTPLPEPEMDIAGMTDEEREAVATAMTAVREEEATAAISLEDVPETVTMGTLSNQYKAVTLPHRKMFETLQRGAMESELAAGFHDGDATLCQGCHHNSPAELKPANCASCHTRPDTDTHPLMPALMGAYHQQCIGCHKSMNIEKTGCTDCHEKK